MTKTALLNYLTWGYTANMDGRDFEELKNKLVKHQKESKIEDSSELAASVLKNFPEFQILHQAFMRTRIDKISSGVNTIKTIAIIYLVASIIGAIAFLAQMS